ncbi:MAG: FkbM family methyltransferase [Alphaproteobacteria bacterium]
MFGSLSRLLPAGVRNTLRPLKRALTRNPDAFLKKALGVVHIGANEGQEREAYDLLGLNVIWVEPIPEVFENLAANIRPFGRQRAFQYLLADTDGQSYNFNVASNGGASSSMLEFASHKDIWPDVHYTRTINIVGSTFETMVACEGIDLSDYDALVLDTQGSELLVLKGCGDLLHKFKYIKAEAADFEAYAGACMASDISDYLSGFGFPEVSRAKFAMRGSTGSYFDILYRRQ